LKQTKTKLVVAVTALLVVLALATGASGAKKPSAYRGTGPAIQGQVQAGVHGNAVKTVGALPFTGLDLAFVVGGGLVLLLAGGTLRRVSRRRA
jgi:hypothetical protein